MPVAQSRTERVIAGGRVVLAGFVLLAVWLNPVEPLRAQGIAYVLLSAYLVYAIGLVPILRPAFAPAAWWPILTHAVDIAAFALFMQFTEGLSSPFFVYFLFSLAAATLRWEWRGALATGVALLVLFVGMTVYATYIAPSPEFDIQVVISRAVVLALATTMLAYLGAAHAHGQERLKSLASWPRRVLPDRSALARDIVESAAHILGAPRLLLIWDTEEPWVDVALWSDSRFTIRHEPPGTFGRVVADALRPYGFICLDATRPMARVVYASDRGLQWWRGAPIDPTLRERFDIQIVASWPVRADGVEGRLFSLDKADIKVEDLVYGEILAGLVSSRLGQADLMEQLRQRAFSEDRLKIARDLHDGVLQSLTAAALQIQAARRLLKDDPAAVEERLSELQRIIAAEHVDIRGFIEQLKPGRPDLPVGSVSLGSHLTGLASRIKRQWGIDVHVAFEPDPLTIPELIATDVYLLVHEALVNAARHARASKVLVAVFQSGDRLSIVVSDDGQGFPFKGRLTLDELRQRQVGPVSLRDRVTALGGQLTVESTADGAKVQVDLPLAGAGR